MPIYVMTVRWMSKPEIIKQKDGKPSVVIRRSPGPGVPCANELWYLIGPGMIVTRKAISAGVSSRGSRPNYRRAAGRRPRRSGPHSMMFRQISRIRSLPSADSSRNVIASCCSLRPTCLSRDRNSFLASCWVIVELLRGCYRASATGV
jgi:hypothetical protein